jgi:hypothetical protein
MSCPLAQRRSTRTGLPLAVLAALAAATAPTAANAQGVVRSTQLRIPQPGNLTIARLELRARGRQSRGPRLRIRNRRQLPRDVFVLGATGPRRGARMSAFVVLARRKKADGSRAAAPGSATLDDRLRRWLIDTSSPNTKQFPNAFVDNTPAAEAVAERLYGDIGLTFKLNNNFRIRATYRQNLVSIVHAAAAALDRPIPAPAYARFFQGLDPVALLDRRALVLTPTSRLVEMRFSQPVVGIVFEAASGLRVAQFGSGEGTNCEKVDADTARCRFTPRTDFGFFVEFESAPGQGQRLGELFPILQPGQPVTPLGDNEVR